MYKALAVIATIALAIFASTLRLDSSKARLAHADEAEQAITHLKLYQTNTYTYSPEGAHGSTLYYWTYACKKIESLFRVPSLNIESLRLTLLPIFLLSILAFFALKNQLGLPAIVFGISAWSVSALSVLYSLYFIQEIFFALFVFLAMSYLYLSLTRQKTSDFVIFGLSCGFALATKETFIIALACLALPALVLAYKEKVQPSLALFGTLALSFACAVLVCIVFYSSFFTNPKGIVDAFASYLHFFDKAQSTAHAKDFLYYTKILFIQESEGVNFGEISITCIALIGALLGLIKKQSLINYISAFCLSYWLVLSLIPYKTPWLLLSLLMPMCVLFGYAFACVFNIKNIFAKIACLASVLAFLYFKTESTKLATQRFANDSRNCFSYVQTVGDLANFINRIESIKALYPDSQIVFSMQNSPFPIPYYLIKYKNISYNSSLENSTPEVFVTDSYDLPTHIELDNYQEEMYGLRENLIIYVYIEKNIFEEIIQ